MARAGHVLAKLTPLQAERSLIWLMCKLEQGSLCVDHNQNQWLRITSKLRSIANRKRSSDVDHKIEVTLRREDASWLVERAWEARLANDLPMYFDALSIGCGASLHQRRGRPSLRGRTLDQALLRHGDERHHKRLAARQRKEEQIRSRSVLGALLMGIYRPPEST